MTYKLTLLACLLTFTSWAQNNYRSSDGRLIATGTLNDQSFSVESQKVLTEFNGNTGFLLVRFDSENARIMSNSALRYAEDVDDIEFVWTTTDPVLDEMLKADRPESQRSMLMSLVVNGNMQEVPVTVVMHRIDGMKGKTVLARIFGSFEPESFDMNTDKRVFSGTIDYEIIMTLQAFIY